MPPKDDLVVIDESTEESVDDLSSEIVPARLDDIRVPEEYKGIYSWKELDQRKAVFETWEANMTVVDEFRFLSANIIADEPDDLIRAMDALRMEFADLMSKSMLSKPDDGNDIVNIDTDNKATDEASRLYIWKDHNEQWVWLGIYSNNFIDRDYEIISAAAHKDFVEAVDNSLWPLPELWYWHIPLPIGETKMIGFDEDTGMAIAGGIFFDEFSNLAEGMARSSDRGMSHGMPIVEIRKDDAEPYVITRYRSIEISVLPVKNAANLLTQFNTKEGFEMPLSKQQRDDMLTMGLSTEQITQFESVMSRTNKTAHQQGLISKDADEQSVQVQDQQNDNTDLISREEFVGVMKELITPLLAEVKELKQSLTGIQKTQQTNSIVGEILGTTPQVSLSDMVKQALYGVGTQDAVVNENDPLLKMAPKQQKQETTSPLHPVPYIADIMSGRLD